MPHISSRFSSACIAFIKQWQGLSLEKYRDRQGNWVIGYGHMLTPDETLTFITPDRRRHSCWMTSIAAICCYRIVCRNLMIGFNAKRLLR